MMIIPRGGFSKSVAVTPFGPSHSSYVCSELSPFQNGFMAIQNIMGLVHYKPVVHNYW